MRLSTMILLAACLAMGAVTIYAWATHEKPVVALGRSVPGDIDGEKR